MPVVRCPLLRRSRGLPLVPAIALALILLLPTACSDNQVTEPRTHPRPELTTAGCSGVCLRDHFTGFSGTLLENHTPDGEGDPFQWIRGGDPGWNSFARIQDNAVEPADDGFPRYDYFADAGAGLDVVEGDIVVLQSGVTSQQELIFYLRATPEAGFIGDGWALRLIIFGSGSTEIDLYKAGTPATFIQTSDPWSPGIYHARFEIIGDQVLNFYIDGALRLSYTDGDEPLGPGTVGIGGFRAGPAQIRLTSFSAGEIEQQRVNVVCSPDSPIRGADVQCKTSLAIPEPYTIVRRTARGSAFTVEDLTTFAHQSGDTNVWQGPAVATSDVVVEVLLGGGGSLTNGTPARFDVQGRSWPVWKLTTLAAHIISVVPGYMTEYPLPPPDTTSFGLFAVDFPDTDSPVAMPTTRPSSGPNQGLVYIRDPMRITDYRVHTHPALYPPNKTTPAGSKLWYKDQNGRGSGTCVTPGDIARLASNVQRHEGVTKAQDSHFGVANDQFVLLQPQMLIEALYSQKDEQTFRDEVFAKLDEFMSTGPYDAEQDKFDEEDTPRVYAIGCTLDYNPGDR